MTAHSNDLNAFTAIRRIVAGALLTASVAATPAAGRPLAHNGQIVFGRDDQLVGDTVLYTINPDGSHEHQVLPDGLECPRWSPDGSAILTCGDPAGGSTRIIDPDTGSYRTLPNPDPDRFEIMACNDSSPDFERLAC